MVIISTAGMCISTLPHFRLTLSDGSSADNPNLLIFEIICIVWFTFEYLARTLTCPSLKEYFKSLMNAIDLLAILPFYIRIIVETLDVNINPNFVSARRSLQVLRIFRVVRIFKVARHSAGLQVLGYTVRNSLPELGLLLMLLLLGMTLFSSLVYYAEMDAKDNRFDSIIGAFWWAIITMTTVGYGDMSPKTTFGKIIGSLCCLSGILFIALPIPTIVSNFSSFYKDHRNKEKLNKINSAEGAGITSSDLELPFSAESPSPDICRTLSVSLIGRQGSYLRRLSTISDSASKMFPKVLEEV